MVRLYPFPSRRSIYSPLYPLLTIPYYTRACNPNPGILGINNVSIFIVSFNCSFYLYLFIFIFNVFYLVFWFPTVLEVIYRFLSLLFIFWFLL